MMFHFQRSILPYHDQIRYVVFFYLYTRFVDAFESNLITNDIDWQEELKKWIVATKKNESIFLEIDLSEWNEAGERNHNKNFH